MIGYLRGIVLEKEKANQLLVLTHDIGYIVTVSYSIFSKSDVGSEMSFYIYQHIREDGNSLYGFSDSYHKIIFMRLISVSGIGPKLAMNILDTLDVKTLVNAIIREDINVLVSVPGVGKKMAQRILLELNGKLDDLSSHFVESYVSSSVFQQDFFDALSGLGYREDQIRDCFKKMPSTITALSDQINYALKNIK